MLARLGLELCEVARRTSREVRLGMGGWFDRHVRKEF